MIKRFDEDFAKIEDPKESESENEDLENFDEKKISQLSKAVDSQNGYILGEIIDYLLLRDCEVSQPELSHELKTRSTAKMNLNLKIEMLLELGLVQVFKSKEPGNTKYIQANKKEIMRIRELLSKI